MAFKDIGSRRKIASFLTGHSEVVLDWPSASSSRMARNLYEFTMHDVLPYRSCMSLSILQVELHTKLLINHVLLVYRVRHTPARRWALFYSCQTHSKICLIRAVVHLSTYPTIIESTQGSHSVSHSRGARSCMYSNSQLDINTMSTNPHSSIQSHATVYILDTTAGQPQPQPSIQPNKPGSQQRIDGQHTSKNTHD